MSFPKKKKKKSILSIKFYQEENSNPRLKGNRKGIIVKGKEFYIPISKKNFSAKNRPDAERVKYFQIS